MSLVPRKYQEELFDHAKQRNTIICADTGTGKTLVAVSLIRHFTQTPIPKSEKIRNLVCFVVPTVGLVNQQAAYIFRQLPLSVARFSSAEGVDNWHEREWLVKVAEADVIVMTAAILQKMLEHGFVDLPDIRLLIFDEAHHTTKKHPYSQIMAVYRRYKREHGPTKLPHILGLTASPIHRAANAAQNIKSLEQNLDATLIEVKLHKSELWTITQRPSISYLMYEQGPASVSEILDNNGTVQAQIPSFFVRDTVNRIIRIREEMGSLAQTLLTLHLLEEQSTLARSVRTLEEKKLGDDLQRALRDHILSTAIDSSHLSAKVQALVAYLQNHHRTSASLSMLIFVTQRDHCVVLAKLLALDARVKNFLRVSWLIGQAKASGAARGVRSHANRQHHEIMRDFRQGNLNCLVVTQVAEEGLDFPACSHVLRFDLPETMTSLIQSRGRARAQNSHLIFFCSSIDERTRMQLLLDAEIASKSFYGQSAGQTENDLAEEDYDALGLYQPSSQIPVQLTAHSAIRLLHETCQLLPADTFTTIHQPRFTLVEFGTEFCCQITLPRMKWLKQEERIVQGTLQPSKKLAKAQVAFEAIKLLHRKGALDEHLMPVRILDKADRLDADGNRCDPIRTIQQPKVIETDVPNPLGSWDGSLYLNVVKFTLVQNVTSYGIICGNPLAHIDPFTVNIGCATASVEIEAYHILPWDADSGEYQILHDFTHSLLQGMKERTRRPEDPMWHLVAPLLPNSHQIDWYSTRTSADLAENLPEGRLLWARLNRRLRPSRFVKLIKKRPDLSLDGPILDHVPIFASRRELKAFPSLRAWFEAGSRPPGPGLCTGPLPKEDEILEVDIVKVKLPSISKAASMHTEDSREIRTLLPASICMECDFSESFLTAISALPFITHNIISQLKVRHALETLCLKEELPFSLATQALTAPDCSCERSYETLECIGDSFLKLAVTVHVYNSFEEEEEGFLSRVRSNTTYNRILQKLAVELQMQAHLIAFRLSSKQVETPKYSAHAQISGSHLKVSLRGKALADCMEACLGAALIGNGLQAALRTADKLKLSVGGPTPWPMRYTPFVRSGMQTSPSLAEIENLLGYEFSNPELLVEALRHRSALSQTSPQNEACYERLEFLGDAVVDIFATMHLQKLQPHADAGQLTNLRSILVCNGSLGYLAVTKLQLHQRILHHSVSLAALFEQAAVEAGLTFQDTLYHRAVWFWDPVKVLCDCFESLMGAVFVDSDWEIEPVFSVLEQLFADIPKSLPVDSPPDPWSLLQQRRPPKCTSLQATISPREAADECYCEVSWHGTSIGLGVHKSRAVAKAKAADEAVQYLGHHYASPQELLEACSCMALDEEVDKVDE